MLCYVNFNVICTTNEYHICNQHLKQPHYQQNLCMREVAYLSLIFTKSSSFNLQIFICKYLDESNNFGQLQYLVQFYPLSLNIMISPFTISHGPCEWIDHDHEV